jgi:phosphatidylglycerophosphatase A
MTQPSTLPLNPASSSATRASVAEPSWRLMLAHPAHWIAFGCGSGLLRPAPGTWGTLAAWFVFVTLDPWLSTPAWLVLLLLPDSLLAQALGFLTFRLFDIVKPPPIRAVDRRFKHGVGVMADDLIAAFYTLLVAAVAVRVSA